MSQLPMSYRLEPGQMFEGRYRILRELGSGGFGMVYLAHQETMGRHVALKVLTPGPGAEEMSAKARFLREVQIISKLRHPNTVTIHDFGETVDGVVYMVLEYIDGETLKDLLRREGAQDPVRALMLMSRVARSVAEAHQYGIIHRDLKPANIMLTNFESEKDVIKVLDFGVARLLDNNDADLTSAGTPDGERALIGTPRYMSPEQVRGQSLGPASDIYSMGLILYETLVGEPAVQGDSSMSLIMQQISPESLQLPMLKNLHMELQRVVRKATEKKNELRFASATEFGDALEQVAMYIGTSGQRISTALPMPSLIRHATGSFAQADLLPRDLLPDTQETMPHMQAFVPRKNQQQPENIAPVYTPSLPGQHHHQARQDDSFIGLAVADLPPPPLDSNNEFASDIVEPLSDPTHHSTPNLVEQKSLTSFSAQIILLTVVSIFALISTYFAFLFMGVIVDHFLDSGAKLFATILITLAIPALTILSESSRKEKFEVIIQPLERVRRVVGMTTLFSGLVVLLVSLLMPGTVIREFRGNPNWFLRSSDAVASEPGKLSSLNRSISFSLASGVEVATRTFGLYDESADKKDVPEQVFRTGPPPSTRPGNPNAPADPAVSNKPDSESNLNTGDTKNIRDKSPESRKATPAAPPKKRSSPVPPTRPQKPVDEDYVRW